MSRDWTPQQLNAVNMQMHGELAKQVISFTLNGITEVIHDPESEDGKAFPNFYFLGNDVFAKLKSKCSVNYFYDIEMVLAAILDIVNGFKNPLSCISDEMLEQNIKADLLELAKIVRDWFEGNLDPGFYYNETNNEVFIEKLIENADV